MLKGSSMRSQGLSGGGEAVSVSVAFELLQSTQENVEVMTPISRGKIPGSSVSLRADKPARQSKKEIFQIHS